MELRDYFDFNSEIDIRIKGHRIAIQHVLNKYQQGKGTDELGFATYFTINIFLVAVKSPAVSV